MQRSVLHSKSFQRYFLTYAAIFAAMIFISILLLACIVGGILIARKR